MNKPYGAYLNRLKKKGPSIPKFVAEDVQELLKLSLKLKPDERSTATELLKYLRGVYKTPGKFIIDNGHSDDFLKIISFPVFNLNQ